MPSTLTTLRGKRYQSLGSEARFGDISHFHSPGYGVDSPFALFLRITNGHEGYNIRSPTRQWDSQERATFFPGSARNRRAGDRGNMGLALFGPFTNHQPTHAVSAVPARCAHSSRAKLVLHLLNVYRLGIRLAGVRLECLPKDSGIGYRAPLCLHPCFYALNHGLDSMRSQLSTCLITCVVFTCAGLNIAFFTNCVRRARAKRAAARGRSADGLDQVAPSLDSRELWSDEEVSGNTKVKVPARCNVAPVETLARWVLLMDRLTGLS